MIYRVYQNSMAKFREWIPHIERRKKGMTTWAQKCMVTMLSKHVFTECTPTCPDYRNMLRDTGYNCYTSIQVTSYTIMQLTELSDLLVTLVQSDIPNTVTLNTPVTPAATL
jgi:hypothetical protein